MHSSKQAIRWKRENTIKRGLKNLPFNVYLIYSFLFALWNKESKEKGQQVRKSNEAIFVAKIFYYIWHFCSMWCVNKTESAHVPVFLPHFSLSIAISFSFSFYIRISFSFSLSLFHSLTHNDFVLRVFFSLLSFHSHWFADSVYFIQIVKHECAKHIVSNTSVDLRLREGEFGKIGRIEL